MEEELKCPNCKNYFINPVLLPCYHSLCLSCALAIQGPFQTSATSAMVPSTSTSSGSGGSNHDASSDTASVCVSEHDAESDKVSVVSETDSGVVCTSRPNSFVGTPFMRGWNVGTPPPPRGTPSALCLICPQCHKLCHFDDETGAHSLPRNKALANVVIRYYQKNRSSLIEPRRRINFFYKSVQKNWSAYGVLYLIQ